MAQREQLCVGALVPLPIYCSRMFARESRWSKLPTTSEGSEQYYGTRPNLRRYASLKEKSVSVKSLSGALPKE